MSVKVAPAVGFEPTTKRLTAARRESSSERGSSPYTARGESRGESPALRYPGAPPGSYVSEEGWLVVGAEAWTEEEWARRERWRDRRPKASHPRRYASDEERLEARRRARRESARRRRGGMSDAA